MIADCTIFGWGALLDVNEQEKQLLRPVRYTWRDDDGLQSHEAPAGYQFDGSSKWFAWRIMGYPWGASAKAALLHDRCFTERFRLSRGNRVTFLYSADLYLAFLEATGVRRLQRNAEYLAVNSPMAYRLWQSHDAEFDDVHTRDDSRVVVPAAYHLAPQH